MSNKDVLILNTADKQLREYVKYYGLKDHSPCLCGSKNTYAECCKKNEFKNYSDSDIKKWQANLLGAIRSDKYIKNPTCMYRSCNCQSIGSHSVQKNRYLNQLADKNGNVYRVLKKYRDGTYKVELKAESLNHATKFNGFCNYHDSSIFNIVESEYSNQFELEQMYAHTYRSIAYSKYKVGQWLTIIRENHFKHLPHVYSSRVASNRGTLDLQALLIHQYRVAEANYNDLSVLMCEIEKNYDHESAKWIIKNDVLDFTSPFVIPTKSLDLVFYNTSVRKYDNRLVLGELDYLAFKHECNDVLTTIVFS